uniref:NADH-ubiquinone oxidoreductase chain 4L n=1 Tax=Sphenophorus sp. BYU-CO246 TaxID=696090 RepID=D8WKM0_9CUCU|nr:NADH dehydrogenase subunit 4L [Sphenophorus sp. BYU-CO246]ACZ58553.1 NADH dehydrogenase subunit 4L [Sphenophorus sp. BYU-CO246]
MFYMMFMSMLLLILISMSYFSGLFIYVVKHKHLLLMLLSLEFIIISLYCLMFLGFLSLENDYFFCMIYLAMSVCESALGLSILVNMIRNHGNDFILSFSSLW